MPSRIVKTDDYLSFNDWMKYVYDECRRIHERDNSRNNVGIFVPTFTLNKLNLQTQNKTKNEKHKTSITTRPVR